MYEGEEDPFVPVWEGPFPEAERYMRMVESSHIPVDLDDALEVGHARVVVPKTYADEARRVIAGESSGWVPQFTEETTDGLAWKPWVRTMLVVMAIALLLLLLFT